MLIGFRGDRVISISSVDEGTSADAKGVLLLAVGLLCYALAANIARPMQRKYGSMAPMLWIAIIAAGHVAAVRSRPVSRAAAPTSRRSARVLMLGPIGVRDRVRDCMASCRPGPAPCRGMIGIFFTPIVGTILGVDRRGDSCTPGDRRDVGRDRRRRDGEPTRAGCSSNSSPSACSRSATRSAADSMPTLQPHQVVGHLQRRAGRRGVGHPPGVLDQALDRAERLGEREQLGRRRHAQRRLARRRAA